MLRIAGLTKEFKLKGRRLKVLDGISFSLKQHEVLVVVGPSGCGKTTLLRIISSLIKPSTGLIEKKCNSIGMVFQKNSLFPWKTVRQNIEFGLINSDRISKKEVTSYLHLMRLSRFADAYPKEISEGMAQRASIARTFIANDDVVLLDEPFRGIDYLLKTELQDFLQELMSAQQRTAIFVTHDIEEAVFFASRVIVLSKRPARIKKEIKISLTHRERDSQDFVGYVHKIREALR